jgi:hypothetical protein
MCKRSERLHPEEMMKDDFREMISRNKVPFPAGLSEQWAYLFYKQAWWDGRASQHNLRPNEPEKQMS